MKKNEQFPVMVSIECCVYNHEPFLRQCLDGFVMQRTNFPFEAIVHDDASTDGSAAIILEYAEKYPDIIKPIIETENQYSKKDNSLRKILNAHLRGKYIACCEGDDYWTDSLKLQKQVDYMENHPECTLCFHNAIVHWYDGSRPDKIYSDSIEERDYTAVELLTLRIPPTASYVYRSSLCEEYQAMMNRPRLAVGDRPLKILCAQKGKTHALPDNMSVYGKHEGGWTHFEDAGKTYLDALSWEEERKLYGSDCYDICTSSMTGMYLNALQRAVRQGNIKIAILSFYRGVLKQPITGISACAKVLWDKISNKE